VNRTIFVVAVAVTVLAAPAAWAQETYQVKFKDPVKGQPILFKVTEDVSGTVTVFDAKGNKIQDKKRATSWRRPTPRCRWS